uniref:beta-ketoacyl synthase N-terminal-like domain-containing protein n=1 Tax=Streptomyces polyasparticus TaxID=2767826 RepID=UPI00280C28EE|nr:beta-ketoacyl synthase N-terminal-like domain-containing protein [Streptomyces polyasparticus]
MRGCAVVRLRIAVVPQYEDTDPAGADAMVTRLSASAFAKMGALSRRAEPSAARSFDRDRDGFVLAEVAAVLLLERAADAAARRVAPRALLSGYAMTGDATTPQHPTPGAAVCDGRCPPRSPWWGRRPLM